jgi:hypothetical protein
MASLQRTLEYEPPRVFSALPSDQEIEQIVTVSEENLRDDGSRRERIKAAAARRWEEAAALPKRILDMCGPAH